MALIWFIHQCGPMSKVSIKNAILFYLVTALDRKLHCDLKNKIVWFTVYSHKY